MAELVEANWLLLVMALVIGVLVAWWVFVRSRRTRVEIEPAEEEAGRVGPRRNQALIDAAPAASSPAPSSAAAMRGAEAAERVIPPAAPQGLAGAGEVVEAAAQPQPAPEPATEPPNEPSPRLAADRVEPTKTAEPPAPSPATAGELSEASAPAAEDELSRIKGLGPRLAAQLREMGITSIAQIAGWDEADIDRIDAQLGRFQGRIRRDNWTEQARLLAAGDTAGYEARFGRL